MRTNEQLILMAVTLRGLCASRCQGMQFMNCKDTFADMWADLDTAVRAEWVALANILDTLFQSDDFQKR